MTRSGARVLIMGCGGIGGTVAAHLFEQGVDVAAVSRNPLVADAVAAHGFRTRGEQSIGDVRGEVLTHVPDDGRTYDYVLLATQPTDVEAAAKKVAPWLADDGVMVCFQNGLCEPRVATAIGRDAVFGGVVAWGATMPEPGVFDRTSAGGFTLGAMDATPETRLEELALMLEPIGPVTLTENLMGARWSKLAINCAISSLGTVGGDRLGPLLRKRHVRRLALEIMSETVEVARAEGVELEKVAGTLDLDWIALTTEQREAKLGSAGLVAKHALLLAVGARYRRLRSSMLRAIERGQEPAVDFLNGEVSRRAALHGIDTPINDAMIQAVEQIAAGKSEASHATLRALYDATRLGPVAPRAIIESTAPVSEAPAESRPMMATALIEDGVAPPRTVDLPVDAEVAARAAADPDATLQAPEHDPAVNKVDLDYEPPQRGVADIKAAMNALWSSPTDGLPTLVQDPNELKKAPAPKARAASPSDAESGTPVPRSTAPRSTAPRSAAPRSAAPRSAAPRSAPASAPPSSAPRPAPKSSKVVTSAPPVSSDDPAETPTRLGSSPAIDDAAIDDPAETPTRMGEPPTRVADYDADSERPTHMGEPPTRITTVEDEETFLN